MVEQFSRTTLLLYYFTILLLYYSTILLLYYSTILLLYFYCTTVFYTKNFIPPGWHVTVMSLIIDMGSPSMW